MDDTGIKARKRGKIDVPSVEFRHLPVLLLGLSLLLAVVAYWPVLEYGFVFDDTQQITQNPALTSWSYLPQYFTAHVWEGVFPGGNGNYYRPLFLLWLRLNYVLFKLAPWGWHLTSLLAHLAATGMVFLVLRQWTGDGVAAGWGALLFSVHPIHIEAVAWVSAVPEALFTVSGLGAIYAYLRYRQKGGWVPWVLSSLLYEISLLTKETAIVIWPIIIACDGWLERDRRSKVWPEELLAIARRQVPFAAATAAYIGLRLHALQGVVGSTPTYTPGEVFQAAPSLLWFYLKKLVVPSGLSQLYFDSGTGSIGSSHFYLPLLLVCATGGGLLLAGWKSRVAAFPGLLLAVSLLPPVLAVSVFPRHDLAHDRYLYLPSVGACMLFAVAVRKIESNGNLLKGIQARWFVHLTVAAVAMVFAFSVRAQETPYRNNLTLFTHAVQISPNSAAAWGFLGEELMTQRRYQDGIYAFQRAQALEREDFLTNFRLGSAYYWVQDMPSAEVFLQAAVNNYGAASIRSYDYALYRLALAQYAQNKMPLAEATLRRAVELNSKARGYHLALGAALKHEGRLRDARDQLQLELALGADPETSAVLAEVDAGLNSGTQR